MITTQLVDFIKTSVAQGKAHEEIIATLKSAGWSEADITAGFDAAKGNTPVPQIASEPLLGPGQILSQSWKIYNDNFWKFIGISVIPLAGWFFIGLMLGAGLLISNTLSSFLSPIIAIILGIVIGIVLVVLVIYLAVWAQASLIVAIRDHAQLLPFKEIFKRGRPYINPYFSASVTAGLYILFGTILLIIPGIIFWVWYSFAGISVILENSDSSQALKLSKSLSKGRWGSVFWRILCPIFIVWGVLVLISIAGHALPKTVGNIVSNVVSLIISPLIIVYMVQLYMNLKHSKKAE